jgi:division protein CdvB (Snf7/Vps24/ESCRT-III family)
MKMERPNTKPLSPEELQDLEKLRSMLEQAIKDGYVSTNEINAVNAKMDADGKVTFEEISLIQKLVWDKIQSGEIQYSW